MFIRKKPGNDALQQAIDRTLTRMNSIMVGSDEHAKMLIQLTQLYKLKESTPSVRVSPDTLVIVFGNLVGIVLILQYEKLNVVASKAVGFVMKAR